MKSTATGNKPIVQDLAPGKQLRGTVQQHTIRVIGNIISNNHSTINIVNDFLQEMELKNNK